MVMNVVVNGCYHRSQCIHNTDRDRARPWVRTSLRAVRRAPPVCRRLDNSATGHERSVVWCHSAARNLRWTD